MTRPGPRPAERVRVTVVETCEAADLHPHGLPISYGATGRPDPVVHQAFVDAHTPHGFTPAPTHREADARERAAGEED